jgi:carbonic anhydrase
MQATTPAQAWQALRAGNARFVTGRREHPNQDVDRRAELAGGQNPFAVVFGCSDSRVAAEIIFDRGLGDLFVVRTAGHVVDSGVLGSIEFGATVLSSPLVVVLGHDRCGAVLAALRAQATGEMPTGYVRDIVERVLPSVITARAGGLGLTEEQRLDQVGDEHIRGTGQLIVERSVAIARLVDQGRCAVIGVGYRLDQGQARLVSVIGEIGDSAAIAKIGVEGPLAGRGESPA